MERPTGSGPHWAFPAGPRGGVHREGEKSAVVTGQKVWDELREKKKRGPTYRTMLWFRKPTDAPKQTRGSLVIM